MSEQWTPRQQEIAKTHDPYAPQECVIYLIDGRDPWYGRPGRDKPTIVVYVGETARASVDRILEHFRDKWWRRDIRGYRLLLDEATGEPRVFACKADAWVEERRLTRLLEPPYPKEYNGSNKWLVIDGRGVHKNLPSQPVWWPTSATGLHPQPSQRMPAPRRPVAVRPKPRPARKRAPSRSRRVKTLLWCGFGWAVVAGVVWLPLAVDPKTPVKDDAAYAAVLASALACVVVWVRNQLRRLARKLR